MGMGMLFLKIGGEGTGMGMPFLKIGGMGKGMGMPFLKISGMGKGMGMPFLKISGMGKECVGMHHSHILLKSIDFIPEKTSQSPGVAISKNLLA